VPEQSLADQFPAFADACEHDGAITYAAICRGVAVQADVLDLIAQAPLAQRRPNLLLAAVHFLLLSGVDHPLAAYYDTVRPPAGEGGGPSLEDLPAVFRRFCLEHRQELLELIATRSTQTNEVGRCAGLLPALATIAAGYPGEPLALLDLGTSAGLNLGFDHYAYAYRQADGAVLSAGDPTSEVLLECRVGTTLADLPPLALPPVADRVGVDLSPIHPQDDGEARWLLACLWPDNLVRFNRVRGALAVARASEDRARLVQGDIIEDLDAVAATIDASSPLVVFHSWVAAYLTEARQRDLVAAVRALGSGRRVHHVYAEAPFETPGLPTPDCPVPNPKANVATALVHIGPEGVPARWADMHPHGSSLRWWATPMAPTGHPGEPAPAPPPR
jgi:hypothetical protein